MKSGRLIRCWAEGGNFLKFMHNDRSSIPCSGQGALLNVASIQRMIAHQFMGVGISTIWLALLCGTMQAYGGVEMDAPLSRPASDEDVHRLQALGRVIVSPDAGLLLYEWGKPYQGWIPETNWLAPVAARRLETYLFSVDLSKLEPTSELLFYPNAGCSYWLGDLSCDGTHVIVFELSHDARNVRAGAWNLKAQSMLWFSIRPDEGRIAQSVAWISNEEFVYPVAKGEMARASIVTGTAVLCGSTCDEDMVKQARKRLALAEAHAMDLSSNNSGIVPPVGTKLVAGAANGTVAIYVRDNDETLSLMFARPDRSLHVLFENSRKWVSPYSPKPE